MFCPLSHQLQLSQIPASPNSSFFKFRLLQIQASKNSGFFKFWLWKFLSPNSSFEKFQLLQIQASKNSSFEKFRLRKILASKNSVLDYCVLTADSTDISGWKLIRESWSSRIFLVDRCLLCYHVKPVLIGWICLIDWRMIVCTMLIIYPQVSLIGDPWVTPEVTPEGVLICQEDRCDKFPPFSFSLSFSFSFFSFYFLFSDSSIVPCFHGFYHVSVLMNCFYYNMLHTIKFATKFP